MQLVSFGDGQSNEVGVDSVVRTNLPQGAALMQARDHQANAFHGMNNAKAFAVADQLQERDLKEMEDDSESKFSIVERAYKDMEDFEERMEQQAHLKASLGGPTSGSMGLKPQFQYQDLYAAGGNNPMLNSR